MNRKVLVGARIFLGLIFTVFGLNGFFQFLPPPPLTDSAQAMMGALMDTGYFMPFLKMVEILSGILLLVNVLAPLAVVILTPVIIQITLFHLFLAPSGLLIPIILIVLWAILVKGFWFYYEKLFTIKA